MITFIWSERVKQDDTLCVFPFIDQTGRIKSGAFIVFC